MKPEINSDSGHDAAVQPMCGPGGIGDITAFTFSMPEVILICMVEDLK